MKWLLYALVAVVLAAAVGIALFPLSLALSLAAAPVTGDVSGRVWNGRIDNAEAGGRPLGVVQVRGAFLPLLRGRGEADIAVAGPSGTGTARALVADGVATLSAVDAAVPVDPYGFEGPFGEPLSGQVTLAGTVTLGPEGCRSADLQVETDALSGMSERLGGEPLDLAGPAHCEDGALVSRLRGANALGDAQALLRLRPGSYTSELTLDPANPLASQTLRANGFRRGPDGYTVVTRGTY